MTKYLLPLGESRDTTFLIISIHPYYIHPQSTRRPKRRHLVFEFGPIDAILFLNLVPVATAFGAHCTPLHPLFQILGPGALPLGGPDLTGYYSSNFTSNV